YQFRVGPSSPLSEAGRWGQCGTRWVLLSRETRNGFPAANLVFYVKQTISVHSSVSSLADASDLVGFFSYSREDDEGSGARLSKLRERIHPCMLRALFNTLILVISAHNHAAKNGLAFPLAYATSEEKRQGREDCTYDPGDGR